MHFASPRFSIGSYEPHIHDALKKFNRSTGGHSFGGKSLENSNSEPNNKINSIDSILP